MRRPFRIRTKAQEQGLVVLGLGIIGFLVAAVFVGDSPYSALLGVPSGVAILLGLCFVFIRLDD
jgi:hypothetical protein